MTLRKPSEVLSAAADLLAPPGAWRQGGTGGGAMCLVAAISSASPKGLDWDRVMTPLRKIVGHKTIAWNDAPGRTQAEVVAALRQASELAKSEEL